MIVHGSVAEWSKSLEFPGWSVVRILVVEVVLVVHFVVHLCSIRCSFVFNLLFIRVQLVVGSKFSRCSIDGAECINGDSQFPPEMALHGLNPTNFW